MQSEFQHFIQDNDLCTKTNRILLGVSGGIDSVCMFHLFRLSGFAIAIAHCNFQLRGEESDGDELFVKSLAEQYDIPLFSTRFETKSIAESEGISIQMAARDLRYEWFEEIRDRYHYNYIAIAHNSDDVIETFFINLSRGSGIKGFTGIKPKTGNIIRPLLFASREKIVNFIQTSSYLYREDSSNSTTKYSRNLIRHEIIPGFEKINPRFKETMLENISRLRETEYIFREQIDIQAQNITYSQNKKLFIDIEKLNKIDLPKTFLYEILSPFGFSSTQINDILSSLHGVSGKQFFTLTHRLLKDRKDLILEEIHAINKNNYLIESKNSEIDKPIHLLITKSEKNEHFNLIRNKNTGLFDLDLIDFPLVIRKWQNGDYFMPLGMQNLKKLSDFFIDNKFSLLDKENAWILESGNKIIWIIGHRIDDRFKITGNTKNILQIELVKNL